MSSENDFLQPNTGDIPLETIDHLRKLTMQHIFDMIFTFWFRANEIETNSP